MAMRILQLALAALFVAAGTATLLGTPVVLAQFGAIDNVTGLTGLGGWIRMTAGVLEVIGGVLLCVQAAAGVGAVVLGAVMTGAVAADLFVLRTPPVAPAALIAVLAAIAYAHRAELAVVAARLERNL